MPYTKKSDFYLSHDGQHNIAYYVYTPSTPAVAVLQIIHGMCEFTERYEEFIEFLTDKGFVVCGEDHLGHGASVSSDDDFGYFGARDGIEHLICDVEALRVIMRKRYRALPYFMLGHSMGSFIAREYITHYRDTIDGLILSGTSGTYKGMKASAKLAGIIAKLRGDHHRSKFIQAMGFRGYNSRFASENDRTSWISRNTESRTRYKNDKRCNFIFTAAGYRDLAQMLVDINGEEWASQVPMGLPIFIISGSDDPVGEYGAGPQSVADRLQDVELYDLSYRIYSGMRHEVLNEIGREEVYNDIYEWLMRTREGVLEDRLGSQLPLNFGR